ncbi:Sensor histidine kinase YesM [Granulicatella balaenopterae]|uniref:Sensor histidine kinase YesM n=1 Tax=Granulicatella balaenopterae TaxID=137733 RepID=A0A1H9HIK8_9LACT|nr:GHKL domain-containing protein [Granulicatella balaenopterae]SEQ62144.1 Sensor histidine kinase YesM [Granulicatella balaenopterae]
MNNIFELISETFGILFSVIAILGIRLKIANTIEPIVLKKKINWLYIFIFYVGGSFFQIGFFGYLVFYYIVFRYQVKKESRYALFYSLYVFLVYESIYYFFISLVYHFIDSEQWMMFYREGFRMAVYLIALVLALTIHHLIGLNQKIIESEKFLPIIKKITDYFIVLVGVRFLVILADINYHNLYTGIKITSSLSIFIITLLVMLYLRDQQLKFQYTDTIKRLNKMIDELGDLYGEVRGFRHDFAGIVATLGPAIKNQDIAEITQIYESALLQMNQTLTRDDYSGFNLTHIKDLGFRNVLAQKLVQAKQSQIPFRLEVVGEIPKVDAPLIDVIRILTILLDNALEATVLAENPLVIAALVAKNNEVSVRIENTYDPTTFENSQIIWKNGYSTKGKNRGVGLVNLRRITAETQSTKLETRITGDRFIQVVTFRKRG